MALDPLTPKLKVVPQTLLTFRDFPMPGPFLSELLITDCHGNCLCAWVTLPGGVPTPNLPGLAVSRLLPKAQLLPPTVLPSLPLVSSFSVYHPCLPFTHTQLESAPRTPLVPALLPKALLLLLLLVSLCGCSCAAGTKGLCAKQQQQKVPFKAINVELEKYIVYVN